LKGATVASFSQAEALIIKHFLLEHTVRSWACICSSCHDSLPNKDSCYTCKITGGYNRCITLDKILESFCVPCSNAKYGCTAKMRYHEKEKHGKSCPHAPCSCPETGCKFTGSTVNLLAHLTGDHKWRSKQVKYNVKFTLQVQEGMRVLHSRDGMPLFLVKFALSPPLGNVTSVLCVDPHATTKSKFKCHLSSNCLATGRQQSFDFHVRNTTLSDGLPQTEDGDYSLFPSSTSSITVIMKKIEQKHLRQSLLPYVAAR
jgi:E3 ubiquitin-protein ligase SIAH1